MRSLLLLALLLPGAFQDERRALLKTFREELVAVEPSTFLMGSAAGPKS
jgi:hypothetical protein